jgi:hypothetical protein
MFARFMPREPRRLGATTRATGMPCRAALASKSVDHGVG